MSRIPDVQFRKRSHRDINKNSRTLETNKRKLVKIWQRRIWWRTLLEDIDNYLNRHTTIFMSRKIGHRSSSLLMLLICTDFNDYQFNSVTQSCPNLCDPMNRSTPGLPVHHQLPDFTQTHVHRVGDAIQPSHPLLSPFPPTPNSSQHESLFQWVNSSHEVAEVLELQL